MSEILTAEQTQYHLVPLLDTPTPVNGPKFQRNLIVQTKDQNYEIDDATFNLTNLHEQLQEERERLEAIERRATNPYYSGFSEKEKAQERITLLKEQHIPQAERELEELMKRTLKVTTSPQGDLTINEKELRAKNVVVAFNPITGEFLFKPIGGRPPMEVKGDNAQELDIVTFNTRDKPRSITPSLYIESNQHHGIWHIQMMEICDNRYGGNYMVEEEIIQSEPIPSEPVSPEDIQREALLKSFTKEILNRADDKSRQEEEKIREGKSKLRDTASFLVSAINQEVKEDYWGDKKPRHQPISLYTRVEKKRGERGSIAEADFENLTLTSIRKLFATLPNTDIPNHLEITPAYRYTDKRSGKTEVTGKRLVYAFDNNITQLEQITTNNPASGTITIEKFDGKEWVGEKVVSFDLSKTSTRYNFSLSAYSVSDLQEILSMEIKAVRKYQQLKNRVLVQ